MRIFPLGLLLVLLLSPTAGTLGADIDLRVTDDSVGRLVHHQRMTAGGRFALRYRHSVEKSPVEEIYQVAADGTIYLVETTVEASGYGLPECAPGQDCVTREGRVTFRGWHRRIEHLVMRVSYLNDMWLIFGNENLNLRQVAAGGSRIVVQAQPAGDP
jgi:hypothetical protein